MVSRELIARHCICCGSDQLDRSPAVLMPFVALRVFGHEPVEITADWGLRDLRRGMAYTLCNSLQCQECSALFLDFRFTDEQMEALYHNYRDDLYYAQRISFEPSFAATRKHLVERPTYLNEVEAWLAPHLPEAPSVLDWGGDTGMNSLFRERNRLLHIHDISGVGLVPGAECVELEHIGQNQYDLVSCNQVLEHIPFPLEFVEQILPAIGPQTLFYLEVPNETLMRQNSGNPGLASLKRHWHEHVNFFTEASIRRLLKRLDLEIVDVLHLPINLGGVHGQIMGVLTRRC